LQLATCNLQLATSSISPELTSELEKLPDVKFKSPHDIKAAKLSRDLSDYKQQIEKLALNYEFNLGICYWIVCFLYNLCGYTYAHNLKINADNEQVTRQAPNTVFFLYEVLDNDELKDEEKATNMQDILTQKNHTLAKHKQTSFNFFSKGNQHFYQKWQLAYCNNACNTTCNQNSISS